MFPTEPKKHPCPDCTFCQWCGDDRCALCLRQGGDCRKLSLSEQIKLYDSLNCCAAGMDETVDTLREYDLKIIQPRKGYRFSLDPLLLCEFSLPEEGYILDMGTGCGIIPLIAARKSVACTVTGVELQTAMAALALRNAELNRLSDRITIIDSDVRDLGRVCAANSFDLVMANPPYRQQGTGRISPRKGRDLARHESTARLADFLAIARKMVRTGGRICLIYHPERLVELMVEASRLKLTVTRLQMVHGGPTLPARMFLIELQKGKKGALQLLPPVLVSGMC